MMGAKKTINPLQLMKADSTQVISWQLLCLTQECLFKECVQEDI